MQNPLDSSYMRIMTGHPTHLSRSGQYFVEVPTIFDSLCLLEPGVAVCRALNILSYDFIEIFVPPLLP